jgi:hypothetical protein
MPWSVLSLKFGTVWIAPIADLRQSGARRRRLDF